LNYQLIINKHYYAAPSLVEVDDEDDVITEAREPVSCRHSDDERKHVINKCIERLTDTQTDRQTDMAAKPHAIHECSYKQTSTCGQLT